MSNTNAESRLTFIDVGRSLAIILMLQGHFISTTFQDYTAMTLELRMNGTSGNIFFDYWCQLRGFTAPLFFTITGLVFTYLLVKNQKYPFLKQKRVKKGLVRGVSIIICGYLLQLQLRQIDMYLTGQINSRFYSFHVLQCIGLGIISLILFYWIYRKLKIIPFEILLIVAGTIFFTAFSYVTTGSNNYFPKNAPKIIQNAFYGPNSIFPIFPWFGFIFFGGVVGVFLNKNKEKIRNIGFILRMLSLGIAFCLLAYLIITILGSIYPDNQIFGNGYWYFMQLAIILVVLTVMLLFDQKTKIKLPFLLAIGQNTLTVYIVHVIVLYGAIFGIGIKTYLSKSLTFGESIIGAVFFILLFGCLTKLQSTLGVKIKRIFSRQNTSI